MRHDITEYLRDTVARGGSDLHLSAWAPACVRINGSIQPINDENLSPGNRARSHPRHAQRDPARHPGAGPGARLRAAGGRRGSLPRKRAHGPRQCGGRVSFHLPGHPRARNPRPPRRGLLFLQHPQRPRAHHRHHRLREIHHARLDGQAHLGQPQRRDHHP